MQAAASIRFPGLLVSALLALFLAGCATQPSAPPEPSRSDRADQARAQGNPQEALRLLGLAGEATSDPREQLILRLRIADIHLDMDNRELAREQLEFVTLDEESQLVLDLAAVIKARMALGVDDPRLARQLINERLPGHPEAKPRLLDVQARALRALNLNLDSARARNALDPLLRWRQETDNNRLLLWETLLDMPMQDLREIMPPAPDSFGAWVELAFLVRSYQLDPNRLDAELELWAERYPAHPARRSISREVLTRHQQEARPANHVVVLLPLSGPLAEAGRALRDGMLAAHFQTAGQAGQDSGNNPLLRFRDVGTRGEDPWAAYMEAVQEGADLVVGPLSREQVEIFATGRELPVPVMTLNAIPAEATPPPNLFRFGLQPEDEAREAARYAIGKNMRHAVVLVPDSSWGRRVGEAFNQAFADNGGVVLEYEYYISDERDFAGPLRRMLDLDASENRQRRLRNTIGRNLEHEPRRRQDVDLMFIGAMPQQAKLIRPQLRFHRGTDIPIMATANVHPSGRPQDGDDDLNGLIFFDMPWLLSGNGEVGPSRAELTRHLGGDKVDRNPRLYAMGMDAYRLIPMLGVLRSNPGETLAGASGLLSMDESGQVLRQLSPAQFNRGRVRALEP